MTEKYYADDKEIDVQETRRLIGPKSFDDNWDLVNYTSELRDRNDRFFAFVDFHENEGVIRECPHCLEYEIHNKLKPRILKKGEQRPPDYEQFIQCWECGTVYPLHQTFVEPEIKDSLETVKSPFESNESVFISTDSRATQRRKNKGRRSSKRFRQNEKVDPDIANEKGIVDILYDTRIGS